MTSSRLSLLVVFLALAPLSRAADPKPANPFDSDPKPAVPNPFDADNKPPARPGANPFDTGNDAPARPAPLQPLPAQPEQPAGQPAQPMIAREVPLPEFLKPGLRMAYQEGQSEVQGVDFQLAPAVNAPWNPKDNQNSGMLWYLAIDIAHAAPRLVAGNASKFIISDVARDATTFGGIAAIVGNGAKFGDYWVHPAQLAQIPEGRGPGQTINRVDYVLDGKTYKALSLYQFSARSHISRIYDLGSGIMLYSSTAQRNAPVLVPDGAGGVGPGRGSTHVTHSRYIGARQLQIPWAAAAPPDFLAKGKVLDFQGTYGMIMQGGLNPLMLRQSQTVRVDEVLDDVVVASVFSRREMGHGEAPGESAEQHCFSATLLNCHWIPPAAFRDLRPNTIIDEDRLTHYSLTYTGIQNNLAIFTNTGPSEQSTLGYDTRNGLLVYSTARSQQAGTSITSVQELKFTGQR